MEAKIKFDNELAEELNKIVVELGFDGNSEFIEEAVRDKMLELKREKFFKISDKVALGLEKNKVIPKEILEDFNRRG
jgi:hypothetical protein